MSNPGLTASSTDGPLALACRGVKALTRMHYSMPCSGSITSCEKWLQRCASFTTALALNQLWQERGFLFPNIDSVDVNMDGQEDEWSLLLDMNEHMKAGLLKSLM